MTRKYHPAVLHVPHPCACRCPATPCQCRRFLRSPRRHLPAGSSFVTSRGSAHSAAKPTSCSRPRRQPPPARPAPAAAGRRLANPGQQTPGPTTLPRPHRYRRRGRVRQHRSGRRRRLRSPAVSRMLSRPAHAQRRRPGSPRRLRPVSARTPVGSSGSGRLGHVRQAAADEIAALAPSRCSWSSNPRASVGSGRLSATPRRRAWAKRIPATAAHQAWRAMAAQVWPTRPGSSGNRGRRGELPAVYDQTRSAFPVAEGECVYGKLTRPSGFSDVPRSRSGSADRQGQALTKAGYATPAVLRWQGPRPPSAMKERRAFSSRFARNCRSPHPLEEVKRS